MGAEVLVSTKMRALTEEAEVIGRLAVADHLGVGRFMKAQIGVPGQGTILAANPIDASYKILEPPAALQVPMSQFVFLRVEILFAARFLGDVLATLERRAI